MLRQILYVFLISALPVIELRGAIPVGAAMGLPIPATFIASVAGSVLPAPFILLFMRRVINWLCSKSSFLDRIIHQKMRKVLKKSGKLRQGSILIALAIFVAVPLPGTGAWTGAMLAVLLDIRMKTALPAIGIGCLIAGIIVIVLTYGVKSAVFG
ncbi:MAG: small multi-drug export protein [Oscillospiraceae bacterium]|jgi:uncharacterized membrane protein|nr:small multi-drug export protein [Oscillospiraceae bacterium]